MMPNPTNIQKLNIKIIQISRRIIKFRITLFISFLSSIGTEALSLKKKKKGKRCYRCCRDPEEVAVDLLRNSHQPDQDQNAAI